MAVLLFLFDQLSIHVLFLVVAEVLGHEADLCCAGVQTAAVFKQLVGSAEVTDLSDDGLKQTDHGKEVADNGCGVADVEGDLYGS